MIKRMDRRYLGEDRIQVKYLRYDGSLNDVKAKPNQKSSMETEA
jgi:hypothetical protein